jgi:hypothetical protein
MSHNRELKNAQQAVNTAVDNLIHTGEARNLLSSEPNDMLNAYDELAEAWTAFTDLQADLAARGPASARATSIAASFDTLPRAFTNRSRILKAVFAGGLTRWDDRYGIVVGGATCDEIERSERMTHQSASAAVNYAESHGWVRDSGHRRLTRSQSMAIVWEPTTKLIEKLAEERRIA